MNKDFYDNLKEIYPPTPSSFSERVESTLAALPKNGARWKMPALAVAAYAVVTCAVLGLMFGYVVKPVAVPRMTAANSPSESPAGTPNPSALPTPAPFPLQQLAASLPKKIDSSDGWQVADAAGDVTWYWRPASSQIAHGQNGKYLAYALDLAQGQSVDAFTFVAAAGGGCIAFTVHGKKGDSVWIVSAGGTKITVPDDVHWVDAGDSTKPLKFDFSGLSMVPGSFGIFSDLSGNNQQQAGVPRMIDSFYASASAPDGDTYQLQIQIGETLGFEPITSAGWQGNVLEVGHINLPDESVVPTSISGLTLKVGKGADGSYFIGSENHKVNLQSNRFAFFRSQRSSGIIGRFLVQYALLVYQNDSTQTLWMLDVDAGKVEKIATGCVAAGWRDSGDYWFAAGADKMMLQTGKVKYDKPVEVETSIGCGYASYNDSNPTLALYTELTIQNHTDKEIIVPEDFPYSLQITKDGVSIWTQNGSDPAKLTRQVSCTSINGDGPNIELENGQYKVPPGYVLDVSFNEIPIDGGGMYALTGTFYNGTQINSIVKVTEYSAYPLPRGIAIDGGINPGGRLSITVANSTINSVALPMEFNIDSENRYSPMVCYRLLSGAAVVKSGTIAMSSRLLTGKNMIVPAGGSVMLTDPGDAPPFDNLPAGDYRLECFLMYDKGYDTIPWGFAPGMYFDVTFTVPAK